MVRNIITIDKDKCVGCKLCVNACKESAIGIVDGKATLLRDDYCDGLGNCLPVCPTGAITFEKREAQEFNKEEVKKHKQSLNSGCKGSAEKTFIPSPASNTHPVSLQTELRQWPVQIKLVMEQASFFDNAHLLIAADCTAFAYANFHQEFMKNKVTLVGCPKLDEGDYSDKLTEILKHNNIKSVTVARMEVPCCGGIENSTKNALRNCGKLIPWGIKTISTDGRLLED